jgi:hypothetical protein
MLGDDLLNGAISLASQGTETSGMKLSLAYARAFRAGEPIAGRSACCPS